MNRNRAGLPVTGRPGTPGGFRRGALVGLVLAGALAALVACEGAREGGSVGADGLVDARSDAGSDAGSDAWTRDTDGAASLDVPGDAGSEPDTPPPPDAGADTAAETDTDTATVPDAEPDTAAVTDSLSDTVTDAGEDTAAPPPANGCPGTYARPAAVAHLDTDTLLEASGLAVSRHDPTLLWTHQDSGDGPYLYAIGTDGHLRARVHVRGRSDDGATRDWEDIAAARCPDGVGDCLWIADIGNNALARDDLAVLVLEEPTVPPSTSDGETVEFDAEAGWRFPIAYPDDPIDAEALFVAPTGDAFWVIEKADQEIVRLYGHPDPLEHGVEAVLEEVTAFPSPGFDVPKGRMLTGADLHHSGTRLVVRAYTGTFEYRLDDDGDLRGLATLEPLLVAVGPLAEGQGEAVCYDADGTGLWTLSEDPRALGFQPLHHYACLPAAR